MASTRSAERRARENRDPASPLRPTPIALSPVDEDGPPPAARCKPQKAQGLAAKAPAADASPIALSSGDDAPLLAARSKPQNARGPAAKAPAADTPANGPRIWFTPEAEGQERNSQAATDHTAPAFKGAVKKTDKVLTIIFDTANTLKYAEVKFNKKVLPGCHHGNMIADLRKKLGFSAIFVDRVPTAQTIDKWIEGEVEKRLQVRRSAAAHSVRRGTQRAPRHTA